MKCNVTWTCLVHKDRYRYKNVYTKATYSDPGGSLVATLSYFLPAKREIRIHTLCRACIQAKGVYGEEEQMRTIHKLADQEDFTRGVVHWKNRELRWRYPIARVEGIVKKIEAGKELELHQFCSATLA